MVVNRETSLFRFFMVPVAGTQEPAVSGGWCACGWSGCRGKDGCAKWAV